MARLRPRGEEVGRISNGKSACVWRSGAGTEIETTAVKRLHGSTWLVCGLNPHCDAGVMSNARHRDWLLSMATTPVVPVVSADEERLSA